MSETEVQDLIEYLASSLGTALFDVVNQTSQSPMEFIGAHALQGVLSQSNETYSAQEAASRAFRATKEFLDLVYPEDANGKQR